ncbi:MAG: site-2 protease family protein [Gammaproteobacteria bacterium]|nr:site-2 protease family protein [Gammaproteobacteria bacterium]
MDLAQFLTTISIAAIPIIFAITIHEVAHGLVARQFGDRTAEMQGRLSLNPIRHIDPIGTVLVPAVLLWLGGFLFGWAKPVPVDSRNMRNPRSNMVWVTAAGPVANVLMALIWALLMLLSQRFGSGTAGEWIAQMAWIGIWFNVVLAVFNMLPIPPLDGGQVLTNLLPRGPVSTFLERVAPFGLFIVLGLLATGLLSPIISRPVLALIGLIAGIFCLHLG